MSQITSVETLQVQLPTRRVHKWTGLTEPIGRYVLVKISDDAGNTGWGEAPALKDWGGEFGRYFGESAAIVETVVQRYLAPAIVGVESADLAQLHLRMDAAIRGYPYAKAAMDFAAYDLAGKALGVPVHTLLGGKCRTHIPVTHSIGLLEFAEAEAEVARVVEEGIKTIKIKIGVEPERDIEMVRRLRKVVGSAAELCVDANEGYATPGLAITTIKRMEEWGIKYAEQPVMGIERLAAVARAVDTPVMADESAWNAHDVIQISEQRAAQIVSIYTTKPGGLYRAMEVAATARAAGIVCNVNGSIETGVGNLANVHLAAAAPAASLSCVIPVSTRSEDRGRRVGGIYYTDDLLAESMRLVDGAIEVPCGPGMGVPIDEDRLAAYRVRD